ncbi:MAG: manganese transporter, partial [Cyanobacteria bacterium P01_D01_bin.115]
MPATLPRLDIAVENVSVTYNNARLALYNAT